MWKVDYECREIHAIRAINYIPKIHVSPQSSPKPPCFSKLHEIRRPFLDLDHEKWKPQISQQIAQNLLNSPTTMVNHAKSTRFLLNSTTSCSLSVPHLFTANLAKFAQFANP